MFIRYIKKLKCMQGLNLYFCNRKWRKKNKDNFTTMGNIFDRNSVNIGQKTYGNIEVYQFKKNNGKLNIGNYCSIAPNVKFILDGEHDYESFSTYPFRKKIFNEEETLSKGEIIIEDDVWIGFGATILSGVHIGQGAIIGANALVTKDIPPYAIVGGVPAKIIKYRFSPQIIEVLLKELDFSKINIDKLKSNKDFIKLKLDDINCNDIANEIKKIID